MKVLMLLTFCLACERASIHVTPYNPQTIEDIEDTNLTQENQTVQKICPTGFILATGNGILGTNDFCVMKFEARDDGLSNAISHSMGTPWASINGNDAQAKCEAVTEAGFTGTFSLISNRESMTLARDIENNNLNWSGGTIGSGHIPRGHSDDSPSNSIGITDPNDSYSDTGNNSYEAAGSGWEQKRVHILSNGSEIWDFSGNLWEWTDWDSLDPGFTLGPTDEPPFWVELSVNPSASLLSDDLQPVGPYTSTHSFGRWYGGAGGAALRGGHWGYTDSSGVFTLVFNQTATGNTNRFGFRCVYRP